jgi:hypothetical protein
LQYNWRELLAGHLELGKAREPSTLSWQFKNFARMKGYISIYQITKEKTRKDLWLQRGGGGGVFLLRQADERFCLAGILALVSFGNITPQFAVNKITLLRRQIEADFSFTDYLMPFFFRMFFNHFTNPAYCFFHLVAGGQNFFYRGHAVSPIVYLRQ